MWQGRPDGAFALGNGGVFRIAFFFFFTSFSVFWMWGASQAGGFFWTFGLLFFFVGSAGLLSSLFGSTVKRRYCWYTLTSQRALIATDIPFVGRRLKSYTIDHNTVLDFEQGRLSSIYFAETVHRGSDATEVEKIGFERLNDGQRVYSLMRDLQLQSD